MKTKISIPNFKKSIKKAVPYRKQDSYLHILYYTAFLGFTIVIQITSAAA